MAFLQTEDENKHMYDILSFQIGMSPMKVLIWLRWRSGGFRGGNKVLDVA